MKITLEFDNRGDALLAMQGKDWMMAMDELQEWLREYVKYGETPGPAVNEVRIKLFEILRERNLRLWE